MQFERGRVLLVVVLLVAAALSLAIISRNSFAGKINVFPHKLVILFTGDDQGQLKQSCGWHGTVVSGGVAKRATIIENLRLQSQSVILVDLGNVSTDTCEGGQPGDIKMDAYAAAYPLMRYQAVGIGDFEARFLKESGRANLYGKSVPLISANVVDAASGKTIASAPWIVRTTLGGIKVGITSVLDEKALDTDSQKKLGIRVLPPSSALRTYIPDLKKRCDVLILLSHTDFETAKTIAAEIPGIDVVLFSGVSPAVPSSAEQVGDTVFMAAKPRSPAVSKLTLDIDANRKITSFTGEYVTVEQSVPEHPKIAKIIEQYDEDIRLYDEIHALPPGTAPSGTVHSFISAPECGKCHPTEYASWQATDHAKAFDSLKPTNRHRDPECTPCHTTGYRSGGFRSEVVTPTLVGVQCEACHGPGLEHSRNPGKGYGAVAGKSACVVCHNPSNSPNFNYEKYMKRVAHPKSTTRSNSP